MYLSIIKHLNIVEYIFKDIKLKKRDKNWKKTENKYKKILGSFLFL